MSSRIEFSTNGTTKATKAPKAAKAPRPTKAETRARADRATLRRRIAGGIGGIGVGVLALSVVHCTEGITLLTGSPWYLSALLAIGIDAGMVGCELAELVGEQHEKALRGWARACIGVGIALSMGLNAYAFSLHATIPAAGAALGLIVPALVLMLGRVAGHLAK